ncbi:MAG: alpha-L-glutamate ligase-like protein [Candidatus Omnitrophica bacterium]|nr:alpha-L-glutamate ligase-like protein [Candidatus Omnitrophota bacterium]
MLFLKGESFGLLGMNRRNGDYLLPNNPRSQYPLVDDKLQTKRKLEEFGFPTAVTYLEITHPFEISRLKLLRRYREFVIKPARGSAGRGILVIGDREGRRVQKTNGQWLRHDELEYHVTNILAGLYSLGGTDDACFVEYRVHSHPVFKNISYEGVPDVRVVIYRGIPVMAMLRLPTKQSDGKANLHQGAMGTGIRLDTGTTVNAVHRNSIVTKHPDTGVSVAGVQVPFWEQILETASAVYPIFGMGYIGVDFVIDVLLGPVILEVNARPGLNIQLANQKGLRHRLDAVDFAGEKVEEWLPAERFAFAKELARL